MITANFTVKAETPKAFLDIQVAMLYQRNSILKKISDLKKELKDGFISERKFKASLKANRAELTAINMSIAEYALAENRLAEAGIL